MAEEEEEEEEEEEAAEDFDEFVKGMVNTMKRNVCTRKSKFRFLFFAIFKKSLRALMRPIRTNKIKENSDNRQRILIFFDYFARISSS